MQWRRLVPTVIVLTACVGVPDEDATGAEIYDQVCASCHGGDLTGGIGPALGSGSAVVERPDAYLVDVISSGRGSMPAFSSTLSDPQIERLVAFLRSHHR